jgi:hypothetical protein
MVIARRVWRRRSSYQTGLIKSLLGMNPIICRTSNSIRSFGESGSRCACAAARLSRISLARRAASSQASPARGLPAGPVPPAAA